MTIKCLRILWAVLAVAGAKSATIIENKNVNVIVNVNAQELAQELWKIIESRLNNKTNNVTNPQSIISDLEKAVGPIVSPSRRSNIAPSVLQVANELDKITRKALNLNAPNMNMLDEEIMTRNIVANMMAFLKMILAMPHHFATTPDRIIMKRKTYVDVEIKIREKDILNVIY
ncbi:hypothetical protein PUN28_006507 [Cardiocondyla obscurior]|uniref:Uncharacterized protein n=1 Tax=Cardiocondyla obscurior TaxID=286306 RepID=A0AAW2GBU8_9HYME